MAACVVLTLSLGFSKGVRGEATFSFEPVESGVYAISGGGMVNLAALDFTVTYDPATLRNPRLTKGPFVPGDASFIVNTAISGELRLLIIRNREIAGDGMIATVSFEQVYGKSPRIISFKSSPVSVAAAPVESQDRTVSPPIVAQPAAPAPESPLTVPSTTVTRREPVATGRSSVGNATVTQQVEPGDISSASGAVGGLVFLGKVSFPGDEPPAKGAVTEPARDVIAALPPGRMERTLPAERDLAREQDRSRSPAGEKDRVLERYPNLLERFRDYADPPTLAGLSGLFANSEGKVRQEPAIVLADGAMTASILVPFFDGGDETPAFLLEKARLVSFKPDERGWLLTVLPEPGTSQARLTVRTERVLLDFPLTVVPPLPPAANSLTLDAIGMKRFLAEQGTGQAPRFDLNGDGRRDYQDTYIFVANILAAQRRSE